MSKKTAAKFSPGHHMGARYGYDVLGDGSIRLASILSGRMTDILEREEGLRALLESTNRFVAGELARTARERRGWWNEVEAELDIGIPAGGGWSFNWTTGSIVRAPAPVAEAEDSALAPAK